MSTHTHIGVYTHVFTLIHTYLHTHAHINRIICFARKWIELEVIVVHKIRQTQINIGCFLS